MINLDTCLKASETIVPISGWCDSIQDAVIDANARRYTPNELILEKGNHFGKRQFRYCERVPTENWDTILRVAAMLFKGQQ
jgi:hypothetical protein